MRKLGSSLVVVAALVAVSEGDRNDGFVSTRATASRLGGLPGRPCAPADASRIKGPCWDPPGDARAIPMVTLQSGKRLIEAPNWKERNAKAVYWFDIPREATVGYEGFPMLPGDIRYEPYAPEGFVRPALPPIIGKSVDEVVAALDALDLPFALYLKYVDCKGVEHDHICDARGPLDGIEPIIRLNVSQRIRLRGTPDEERFRPDADKLENRPTEEVVAELKKIGFPKVELVEMDLPCKRGIVCRVPGNGGYQRVDQPVLLWIRKP